VWFLRKYVYQCDGIQYVALQGVMRLAGLGHMHQATERFGPQGAMNEPLGVPGGFKRARGDFPHHPQKEWHAKGSETGLLLVIPIGAG
jgi:hypothetical protein